MGGPTQKQIANAIPTWASDLERWAGVVMSERIALETIRVSGIKAK